MLRNTSRFLLTDALPYELPVIFSNHDFVTHISKHYRNFIQTDLTNALEIPPTLPHKYTIHQGNSKVRTLSVMNPIAQLQTVLFINKYQHDIIHFSSLYGEHSLRKPSNINPTNLTTARIQHKFKKMDMYAKLVDISDLHENNGFSPYFESYFAYTPHSRIHSFETLNEIAKLEKRFQLMLKTDISSCFNSIYTHSISWAYTGDKHIAKQKKNHRTFDFHFDKLMQRANYDETHGILIGSNLSRIFAELIMSKIDYFVTRDLKQHKLYEGKDYKYLRYIDDIFVFANSRECLSRIKQTIITNYEVYNLFLNSDKTYMDERPFCLTREWYTKARDTINRINTYKAYTVRVVDHLLKGEKHDEPLPQIDYQLLFMETKHLLNNNRNDSTRIANYISSTFCRLAYDTMRKIALLPSSSMSIHLKEDSIGYFFSGILNQLVYLTSLNLNYSTVNNLYKTVSLIKRNFVDHKANIIVTRRYQYMITDIETIIESRYENTECSNLIILMSLLDEEININTIKNILDHYSKETLDLFVLFSLAFYINKRIIKQPLDECRGSLNKIIESRLNKFIESSYFSGVPNNNRDQMVIKALSSSEYYFLNGFYHYPLIDNQIKQRIKKLLHFNTSNGKKHLFETMNGFEKSFIKWELSLTDSLKVLLANPKNSIASYL